MIRIVKLSFHPKHADDFEKLFEERKARIANFPGCSSVQLLCEHRNTGVYFTYSMWDSPESLGNYRTSELFKETWAITKQWFNAKPEAWSVDSQAIQLNSNDQQK